MSPELSAKVQLWRQKAREGTLTQDEMREAIATLRAERTGAAATSEKSREKKAGVRAKANISSDDLLSQLDNI